MDRTELLSTLNPKNISLDNLRSRTLKNLLVLPNGHLQFNFNKGDPVLIPRNMFDVPVLNYIEAVEIAPYSLTVRTKAGEVYTQSRENEFVNDTDIPALLSATLGENPRFKKIVTSGYLETIAGKISPNLGLENRHSDLFCAYWYRTLNIVVVAGAWRTVPLNSSAASKATDNVPVLSNNNLIVQKGRYLFELRGSAGISGATGCYGKYRLFNITTNTPLGYSPVTYNTGNNAYESSSADFSCEINVVEDNTALQLQFRSSVNCRLAANYDWGLMNNCILMRLD